MGEKGRLLDDIIKKGELCVVAGVKDVGKTTLLLNLASEYEDADARKQVLFYYALKNGEIYSRKPGRVKLRDLSELPLQTGHIILEAGWAIEDYGLLAVVVDDYRYLLRTEMFRKRDLSRSEKILYLLTRLKTIAEAYDAPVIISSNVDDDYIWGRHDKRPSLFDLPDHEYVEMIADKLLLLHREELFDKESEDKGIAELEIFDLCNGTRTYKSLAYLSDKRKFCVLEK